MITVSTLLQKLTRIAANYDATKRSVLGDDYCRTMVEGAALVITMTLTNTSDIEPMSLVECDRLIDEALKDWPLWRSRRAPVQV